MQQAQPAQPRPNTAPAQTGKPYQQGGNRKGPKGAWRQYDAPANKKPQTFPVRTLAIRKVFFEDIEDKQNDTMARLLKSQRVKIMKDTLEKFGIIERFEVSESDASVYATYTEKENANKAIDALKKEAKTLVDNIKVSLNSQNQPASLCPNFLRYSYTLVPTRIHQGNAKNLHNKVNSAPSGAGYKNVVANPRDQQPQPASIPSAYASVIAPSNGVEATAQTIVASEQGPKDKKPRKNKKPRVQVQHSSVVGETLQQAVEPIGVPVQNEQQRKQATENLMRDAEVAKLRNELQFYERQQVTVRSELDAEKERLQDRDARIISLSQDLSNINIEKERIEAQLNAEQSWRTKGHESIQKLEDESNHLHEQAVSVSHRLQILQNGSVSTKF